MRISLLGIALLLLAAAPQTSGQTGGVASGTRRQLDLGKYEGGTYFNDFFGLSFTPPPWLASTAERNAAINEESKAMISTGDKRQDARIHRSIDRSRALLSMTKLPPGMPSNASLLLIAERLPSPDVKTPADTFRRVKEGLKSTQFEVEFQSIDPDVRIRGVQFATATVKTTTPQGVFRQKLYVTLRKGYSLQFGLTYLDDADLAPFEAAMKTVVIK